MLTLEPYEFRHRSTQLAFYTVDTFLIPGELRMSKPDFQLRDPEFKRVEGICAVAGFRQTFKGEAVVYL